MSDIKFIMAQVYMAGLYGTGLLCDDIAPEAVSAENEVLGEEWFVPVIDNGIFDHYDRVLQPTAPTADSVLTVKLRDPYLGNTKWILGASDDWVDRVNACCGTTPAMPDINIVPPMLEEFPCGVQVCTPGATTYTYSDVFAPLVGAEKYILTGSQNGVPWTPSTPLATPAATLTYANANLASAGTWSLSTAGDALILKTTTGSRGYIKITKA